MADRRSTFIFSCAGLESQVILDHFNAGLTDEEVCEELRDIFWFNMRVHTSSSQTLVSIRTGDVSTGFTLNVGQAGTGNVNQLTNQCAYLLTKVVSGSRNGRMFWPGPPEANYDPNGQVTSSAKTAIDTVLDTIVADLITAGVQPRVVDKDGVGHNVTDMFVRPTVGTQRRRLRN